MKKVICQKRFNFSCKKGVKFLLYAILSSEIFRNKVVDKHAGEVYTIFWSFCDKWWTNLVQ